MKKALVSILVSAALFVGQMPAMAANDKGPLPPGAAAGVQKAQNDTSCQNGTLVDQNGNVSVYCIPTAWVIGALVVIGAGVYLLSQGTNNKVLTFSTTTTSPVPFQQ